MKVIYIAGLEHSGTTLTDHLLSSHPNILGLGEISSFFSPEHMKRYIDKWGSYPDAILCSCGRDWRKCEFWGDIVDLCGLHSDGSMLSKYRKLFKHVRLAEGEEVAVVDSSKSLRTLEMLVEGHKDLNISLADILVIFTVKDVRSFAASMINKTNDKNSLVSVFHSFNYWLGANRMLLDFLEDSELNVSINLYEQLCNDPRGFIRKELSRLGYFVPDEVDIKKNTSHIAMGNKNFIVQNRKRIAYDSRWYNDDKINLAYVLHRKARSFNKHIYSLASQG